MSNFTAAQFIERLKTHQSELELAKIKRYFKSEKDEYGKDDEFMGVKMGQVFELAKAFISMPPAQIELLMESSIHEVRAGALSIMDKQARNKKTTPIRRKELFELYLKRHDRINNWDLVDLGAIHVVGGYLVNQPRDILYQLALSANVWERRTAIVSTAYFIRQKDTTDTFKIAEILVHDPHDLIHKAVGGWIREAGKSKREYLIGFLDKYAATMPRTMLRYAIEHFDQAERTYYLDLKKHKP
ncbi:DNA alkylation repair protein [Pedobacter sp. Hv1]|uniref:DNA alkylation repair protein n=1 Tax=Pedobacter sp. Hv1 TaxID=1740090 RepID=UPI0006D88A6F|nr:DNA alkylation repair protein [Pedobacter sp. Hv1]KQC02630.1 DNA alkylation repair protein [Pedobacter sp. Hv1]